MISNKTLNVGTKSKGHNCRQRKQIQIMIIWNIKKKKKKKRERTVICAFSRVMFLWTLYSLSLCVSLSKKKKIDCKNCLIISIQHYAFSVPTPFFPRGIKVCCISLLYCFFEIIFLKSRKKNCTNKYSKSLQKVHFHWLKKHPFVVLL